MAETEQTAAESDSDSEDIDSEDEAAVSARAERRAARRSAAEAPAGEEYKYGWVIGASGAGEIDPETGEPKTGHAKGTAIYGSMSEEPLPPKTGWDQQGGGFRGAGPWPTVTQKRVVEADLASLWGEATVESVDLASGYDAARRAICSGTHGAVVLADFSGPPSHLDVRSGDAGRASVVKEEKTDRHSPPLGERPGQKSQFIEHTTW